MILRFPKSVLFSVSCFQAFGPETFSFSLHAMAAMTWARIFHISFGFVPLRDLWLDKQFLRLIESECLLTAQPTWLLTNEPFVVVCFADACAEKANRQWIDVK